MQRFFISLFLCIAFENVLLSQKISSFFTPSKSDSLRGILSPERECYDVYYYDLRVKFDLKNKTLQGSNTIFFHTTKSTDCIQLDLFANMFIDSIVYRSVRLKDRRVLGTFYINFPTILNANENANITVYYHGSPTVAVKPPWQGGIVWQKDNNNNPWVGMACEGLGASSWWPCKDHMSDKPDSVRCVYEVPNGLDCIGNGTFGGKRKTKSGYSAFEWNVHYPISTYNITFNIGIYRQFQIAHKYAQDSLAMDFYVLPYHLNKAKAHFKQVDTIVGVLENFFGKYPFPKDGYALVESHYPGMEHQSAIAYGNGFKNGYLNTDFIILHETAHEWWGNHVAADDMADMWIQEAFATYSEWLYYEYLYGKRYVIPYAQHQRKMIENKLPLLGIREVNYPGLDNIDIYYKGAWMLHTLRSWTNNDSLWFGSLRAIQDTFALQTINTSLLLDFMQRNLRIPLEAVMNYYLKKITLPIFEYEIYPLEGGAYTLRYHWLVEGAGDFDMPINIFLNQKIKLLKVNTDWQTMEITSIEALNIRFPEDDYLVAFKRVK